MVSVQFIVRKHLHHKTQHHIRLPVGLIAGIPRIEEGRRLDYHLMQEWSLQVRAHDHHWDGGGKGPTASVCAERVLWERVLLYPTLSIQHLTEELNLHTSQK